MYNIKPMSRFLANIFVVLMLIFSTSGSLCLGLTQVNSVFCGDDEFPPMD